MARDRHPGGRPGAHEGEGRIETGGRRVGRCASRFRGAAPEPRRRGDTGRRRCRGARARAWRDYDGVVRIDIAVTPFAGDAALLECRRGVPVLRALHRLEIARVARQAPRQDRAREIRVPVARVSRRRAPTLSPAHSTPPAPGRESRPCRSGSSGPPRPSPQSRERLAASQRAALEGERMVRPPDSGIPTARAGTPPRAAAPRPRPCWLRHRRAPVGIVDRAMARPAVEPRRHRAGDEQGRKQTARGHQNWIRATSWPVRAPFSPLTTLMKP